MDGSWLGPLWDATKGNRLTSLTPTSPTSVTESECPKMGHPSESISGPQLPSHIPVKGPIITGQFGPGRKIGQRHSHRIPRGIPNPRIDARGGCRTMIHKSPVISIQNELTGSAIKIGIVAEELPGRLRELLEILHQEGGVEAGLEPPDFRPRRHRLARKNTQAVNMAGCQVRGNQQHKQSTGAMPSAVADQRVGE